MFSLSPSHFNNNTDQSQTMFSETRLFQNNTLHLLFTLTYLSLFLLFLVWLNPLFLFIPSRLCTKEFQHSFCSSSDDNISCNNGIITPFFPYVTRKLLHLPKKDLRWKLVHTQPFLSSSVWKDKRSKYLIQNTTFNMTVSRLECC
jgi:hypothetical protein